MRFILILLMMALTGWAQPIVRNPVTTNALGNATGALTNDGAGNIGWSASVATQTNWSVNAITNAGTAAYSNASAFYLSSNPSNYITLSQVPAQTTNTITTNSALGNVNASGALTNNGAGILGWFSGFLTSITSANVTTALGYTPATNNYNGITNSLTFAPATNTFQGRTHALGFVPATNGAAVSQTNISWLAVTNLTSATLPSSVITNAPWSTITGTASNQVAFVAWNGTSWVAANAADTVYWRNEFFTSSGEIGTTSSSGGDTSNNSAGEVANHPGATSLYVRCNSSSSSVWWSSAIASILHYSGSAEYYEADWRYLTLPSGTNLYSTQIGLGPTSTTYPTDGEYFQFDVSTTNVWQCVSAKSSSYTTNFTGTTVVNNTWYKLGVKWDSQTNVVFSINGSPVYTNSTPSTTPSGVWVYAGVRLNSTTSGGSSTTFTYGGQIDYVAFYQNLGTSR